MTATDDAMENAVGGLSTRQQIAQLIDQQQKQLEDLVQLNKDYAQCLVALDESQEAFQLDMGMQLETMLFKMKLHSERSATGSLSKSSVSSNEFQ